MPTGRMRRHDSHRHHDYRYKRPPRKRKAVAIEAPAVVTTKSSRRPVLGKDGG